MKVIRVAVDYKHVAALTVLIRSRVADSDPSVVVEVEEESGIQDKRFRQRQFRKIVVVNVVLILIIDRPQKCVSEALKLSGVEY